MLGSSITLARALAEVDVRRSKQPVAVALRRAVAAGSEATWNGFADSVAIRVAEGLILELQPNDVSPLTWASSSPTTAAVSPDGIATGLAKGTTTITVFARGVTSAPALLRVEDPSGRQSRALGVAAEGPRLRSR